MAASVLEANEVEPLPLVVPLPPTTMLSIPDFLDVLVEEAEDNLTYETTHKDLLLKDWLTPGLSTTEIQPFFPSTADHIDKSNGTHADLTGFKTNVCNSSL
jgi:hypothetical protein